MHDEYHQALVFSISSFLNKIYLLHAYNNGITQIGAIITKFNGSRFLFSLKWCSKRNVMRYNYSFKVALKVAIL